MTLSTLNGAIAWKAVCFEIIQDKSFRSVTGIEYDARVLEDNVFYKGGERNNGEEESMGRKEFIEAFDAIRRMTGINTNTIKEKLPSTLYRKRTPFIGMLYSAGIIN